MNWDDFADTSETQSDAGAEQLCPEGTHVATIGWVKIQPKDWAKGKNNPEGQCLTVRLDFSKEIKSVFDSIPCDRRGSIEALCRSARIEPPRGDWDETQLKDHAVTVETVIAVSKAGRDYVKVERYKPNADPLPKAVAERTVNRTATQKADAASGASGDDIPF
jgi:hypothetical protein